MQPRSEPETRSDRPRGAQRNGSAHSDARANPRALAGRCLRTVGRRDTHGVRGLYGTRGPCGTHGVRGTFSVRGTYGTHGVRANTRRVRSGRVAPDSHVRAASDDC